MGSNTISQRNAGDVILAAFFNDLRSALSGDFMGRDINGIATAGNNLGTQAYPWGTIYASQLLLGGTPVNISQLELPPYQITSGKTRSGSNQPSFIQPAGSAASFSVLATAVDLVLTINGAISTWDTDKTAIPATVAPSSQNTMTTNDAALDSSTPTKTFGEYGSNANPYYSITVASMGTNISNRIGSYQAFKVNTTGEIYLGFVESATAISRCYRGFFFDSSMDPIPRGVLANSATHTLMNLGWVFADADGTTIDTIFVGLGVNNSPIYSATEPASPATNDYWFDNANQTWKQYNGATWDIVDRILIGLVVCDATNCIAARSFDFFGLCRSENTIELARVSNTVVQSAGIFEKINVNGNVVSFATSRAVWDTASNLAGTDDRYNAAVTASKYEYFYVTDEGETKISDMEPYWRGDLLGHYHPYNPWRCVGKILPDGSANFTTSNLFTFGQVSFPSIGDGQLRTRHYEDASITTAKIVSNPRFQGSGFGDNNSSGLLGGVQSSYGLGGNGYNGLALAYVDGTRTKGHRILGGTISAAGAVVKGTGFTSSKVGTGVYRITLSRADGLADKWAMVASADNNITGHHCCVQAVTSTVCEITIWQSDAFQVKGDAIFHFIAFVVAD